MDDVFRMVVGIDQWGPKDVADLPKDIWAELAELLNAIESSVAWPSHILYNIIL